MILLTTDSGVTLARAVRSQWVSPTYFGWNLMALRGEKDRSRLLSRPANTNQSRHVPIFCLRRAVGETAHAVGCRNTRTATKEKLQQFLLGSWSISFNLMLWATSNNFMYAHVHTALRADPRIVGVTLVAQS